MIDIILKSSLVIILIIVIIFIYSVIKIFFITKEIKETGTLKTVGFFEFLIRDYINEDIETRKNNESPSK